MSENTSGSCQCNCSKSSFFVIGKPLFRAYCHCTFCQEYNQAPFADVTVFRFSDVNLPDNSMVEYATYRPPPAVQRGKCKDCNKPLVEVFTMPLFPKLVMVPTENIQDKTSLPASLMHMFYNRRVDEIEDALPKYNGYMSSQLAFFRKLLPALFRKRS